MSVHVTLLYVTPACRGRSVKSRSAAEGVRGTGRGDAKRAVRLARAHKSTGCRRGGACTVYAYGRDQRPPPCFVRTRARLYTYITRTLYIYYYDVHGARRRRNASAAPTPRRTTRVRTRPVRCPVRGPRAGLRRPRCCGGGRAAVEGGARSYGSSGHGRRRAGGRAERRAIYAISERWTGNGVGGRRGPVENVVCFVKPPHARVVLRTKTPPLIDSEISPLTTHSLSFVSFSRSSRRRRVIYYEVIFVYVYAVITYPVIMSRVEPRPVQTLLK